MSTVIRWIGWVALLAGALLITQNSLSDFGPGGEGIFVEQKGEIGRQPLWIVCLYVHVVAGIVCLLSVLPQFSRKLLRRIPALHRWCGRIYAASVLFVLSPTGIYLAFFAKGGLAGKLGFLLLGAVTFHTTLRGVTSMIGGTRDLIAHREWMTRSFAYAASAITFRVYHLAFLLAGMAEEKNYAISLWLSILGNAAVAELVLRRRSQAPTLSSTIPSIS
ncbi:DUF2306 domain-containing protein [Luteolibacter soli]|uniref:DUF2306 domain-containing protein n=1 Tax=Luteolibacter soli TaxID=3135280 RepID=A0ABU9ATS2_9BACT